MHVVCYLDTCTIRCLCECWHLCPAEIGLGLVTFGLAFLCLGVVLIFDKGLLAMGNVSPSHPHCTGHACRCVCTVHIKRTILCDEDVCLASGTPATWLFSLSCLCIIFPHVHVQISSEAAQCFFSLSAFRLCLTLSCLPLHIHVQDLIMQILS